MKVVVALAGTIADTALLRDRAAGAELVVAADSGAERLLAVGIQPDVVIGDFDSIGADTRADLEAAGVEFVAHPLPDYRTDAHVALQLAAARGAAEVVLLGARGGERVDHSLSNALSLVAEEFAAMPIRLVSGWSEAEGVFGRASGLGRCEVRFQGTPGDYVSLVAVSGKLDGVTTVGLRWELAGATLALGSSVAVSNELAGAEGGFVVESGVAIATHTLRQAFPDA